MKKPINKKAQVYGLSAFLYALAIAIVLVIGLLGMSKEFEQKSDASLYRFGAVTSAKNAELIKKILDQERKYVLDKSMFIAGAFGGYSPHQDFIKTTDCNIAEAAKNSCGTCNSVFGGNWKCHPEGYCYDQSNPSNTVIHTFNCYGSIADTGTSKKTCGVRLMTDLPYLGEKKVAYWKNNSAECIPTLPDVVDVVEEYAGNFFGSPDPIITTALSASAFKEINFNYLFNFVCYPGKTDCPTTIDAIEVEWYPIGSGDGISISYPPEDPIIKYEFQPFIHSYTKTEFFRLYDASKDIIAGDILQSKLIDNYRGSPIPTTIDQDFIIAKGTGDEDDYLIERSCQTDPYPSEYCTKSAADTNKPFRALVQHTIENYPNTPYSCTADYTQVSKNYAYTCTIHTVKNSIGKLAIDPTKGTNGFSGDCATGTGNSVDDAAIMCVMKRTINNLNEKFNQGETGPGISILSSQPIDIRYEFYSFNLTFEGTGGNNYRDVLKYNISDYNGGSCGSDCQDAKLVNAHKYCPGEITVKGTATIDNDKPTQSCGGKPKADIEIETKIKHTEAVPYTKCRAFYPVKLEVWSADGDKKIFTYYSFTGTDTIKNADISDLKAGDSDGKIKFKWTSLYDGYPDDSVDEVLKTNVSICREPSKTFKVSVNPLKCSSGLHRGGWNCVTDGDCCTGDCDDTVCIGESCGGVDETCCSGTPNCDSNLRKFQPDPQGEGCVCKECGNYLLPCCSGDVCGLGLVCDHTYVTNGYTSIAGTCIPCGGLNADCCEVPPNPKECMPGLTCENDKCTIDCGKENQQCCNGITCNSGLVCVYDDLFGPPQFPYKTCENCGDKNEYCCAGSNCNGNLDCVGGKCIEEDDDCGASGESCCLGDTCNSGLNCFDGTCQNCGDLNECCCGSSGTSMINGWCTTGSYCEFKDPCAIGTCINCGGPYEDCCTLHFPETYGCEPGYICFGSGSGGTTSERCEPCSLHSDRPECN